MKKLLFAVLIYSLIFSFSNKVSAQISSIVIGVDGFTCSLCAKGVEGQFKSLSYVKSVNTDLKKTEFTLKFDPKQNINLADLKQAVIDGGFTVREIKIDAKGSISGDQGSGYYLSVPNITVLSLKDVKGKYAAGDKVSVKGKINSEISAINVTSIKKI